ncbi:peptidoglycan-binding domain-containing protein [Microvirga tunisiensis]|jgi:hypothetical protein|uniref:Peptidoglycan-binding protein n=1 Tax=Microvirga tunisiensis TaxID=2108360 RepID=A0A5N7MJL7_9HYPH|nr:peptidoglycan-binding domain-containing protein [Microvirga tunisiensis]MPR09076.1 peptidoglycan-binding protein [Microvirga tunisiensis]MPR27245.1 peptidoglycan-binding protein [Microvirga tunisiensis]
MLDPLDSGEPPEEQLPTLTSAFPAGSPARGLRAQVANLSQIQLNLLSEQARALAAIGEWKRLQAQLPAVREELRQLMGTRDQAQSELVVAQPELSGAINRASQAHGDVSTTGLVGSKAPDPKQAIAATAQKALPKLGYGKLTADRVVGPGTRRAIEAFQRDKGLTVTGKLDGPTLKQLTRSLKVAARRDATPHVEMSMR